ncbi:MAG: 4Fe-4S binding protein [Pseudomonadota bacterium]
MSQRNNPDAYDRILRNMRRYPNDIPMVDGRVSPAFREYIELMFTPEEAEIAQHLELRPAPSSRFVQRALNRLSQSSFVQKMMLKKSIRDVARKAGKSYGETRLILERMTDNGAIQDIGGYSYFLTMPHLFNIGFKYSKALDRLGKKGAELYRQFFVEEKFYKRYQASDRGTPVTRIVPVGKSLQYQSDISNAEEMHGLLDDCREPIVITDCPCRNRTEILGVRECRDRYPIRESCFQVGLFGEYFLKRGEGRRLSRDEAHRLVDEFAQLGLIFTTENTRDPNRFVICCCCECCCALIRGMTRFPEKNEACSAKANYLAWVDAEKCRGCGLCAQRCVFKAVSFNEKVAVVNPDKCYGCGVCAVTCPTGALRLRRCERSPIHENGFQLMNKIYEENRR